MAYSADTFVADEQPTTAKWNKLWSNDASFNDGTGIGDDTIDSRHYVAGSIDYEHFSSGAGAWEMLYDSGEIGSPADSISSGTITARKFLRVYAVLLNSGNLFGNFRFNNDSGNNYSTKGSTNFGAAADTTSQSAINGWLNGADSGFVVLDIINMASQNKSVILTEGGMGGAASAAPFSVDLKGKWVNTSAQITRVDVINTGTGDFAAGSRLLVFGRD